MFEEIKEHFGFLLEEDLLEEISEFGVLKSIDTNDTIIEPGAYIKSMPLLLEGAIKFRE